MPRLAIFDSRVWWGIPSFAAAPRGPETRPWHSANAASIAFRSRSANSLFSSGRTSWRRNLPPRLLDRFSRQPGLINEERVSITQDHGTLNDVLQFADVSWPIVGLEKLQRLLLDMADPLAGSPGISFDQVFCQQRNVIFPLAQRWYAYGENVDPIEKILAEFARAHGGFQVAVRCGEHAHVDGNRLIAPDPLQFSFLKHT